MPEVSAFAVLVVPVRFNLSLLPPPAFLATLIMYNNNAAPAYGDDRIMRYTPPTGEFEVMTITCNPGESISLPVLPVHSIFIVIEGSGNTDNEDGQRLVMRPGRCYLMPANCPALTVAVNPNKRGPLRIALAHENQHIDEPNLSSAEQVGGSKQWNGEFALPPESPMTSPAPRGGSPVRLNVAEDLKAKGVLEYKVPKL